MACEVKLMFLPPFEVFCDLLMQGPMETQNIIKERCFFRLVTSVGQRKNSESPQEIKPQTFRFCALILYLSHRDSTVSKVYYKVCMTHVLHTARISNVNNIMFVDGNKRDGDKRDKILFVLHNKEAKIINSDVIYVSFFHRSYVRTNQNMCVIQLILKMLKNKLLSGAKMAGNLGQIVLA